jgi:hypothetical protein
MYSSLIINFVLPCNIIPLRIRLAPRSHPSVLPRAGLGQAGFASGSETTRKPQALFFLLVPPGQKHNSSLLLACVKSGMRVIIWRADKVRKGQDEAKWNTYTINMTM